MLRGIPCCIRVFLQPRPHSGRTAQRTDAWVRRHSSQGEEAAPPDVAGRAAGGPAARAAEQPLPPPPQQGHRSSPVQAAVPVHLHTGAAMSPLGDDSALRHITAHMLSVHIMRRQHQKNCMHVHVI